MIDLAKLREFPEQYSALIGIKDASYNVARLLELDARARAVQVEVEQLRNQRNLLAKRTAQGVINDQIRHEGQSLHEEIKLQEALFEKLYAEFRDYYLRCPNIPLPDVPWGNKENNQVISTFGKPTQFSFEPRHHVALNDIVRWFDFVAAAHMTGSQFVLYRTEGARLLYTLALLMMQHNEEHGYTLVIPPDLVTEKSLEGASNFPRFRDAVYAVPEDGLYLTPTAEVNLTNLYRDYCFNEEELPVRLTAWTSCFRREAGTYGASERGLIRIHQFEKVELYTLCTPTQAQQEHERMIACAELLLRRLGLHYRVSLLAGQDCSFAAAKTYDIEVWMPGQKEYKEVSSSSYCTDFQARRCNIKFRCSGEKKSSLVHTLNTSSLALPRVMVALMETYQQPDGSIQLPPVLDEIIWVRKGV